MKRHCETGYERNWYWPAGPAEGYVAALWGERICREVSGQGFCDSRGEGAFSVERGIMFTVFITGKCWPDTGGYFVTVIWKFIYNLALS